MGEGETLRDSSEVKAEEREESSHAQERSPLAEAVPNKVECWEGLLSCSCSQEIYRRSRHRPVSGGWEYSGGDESRIEEHQERRKQKHMSGQQAGRK